MKKEVLVISKDIIKRKNFLKKEINMILFKSILKNFQIKNSIRVEMQRRINMSPKRWKISSQNNVCIKTGRFGGVFKNWNISRHYFKNLAKFNLLTNVQMKSQ